MVGTEEIKERRADVRICDFGMQMRTGSDAVASLSVFLGLSILEGVCECFPDKSSVWQSKSSYVDHHA